MGDNVFVLTAQPSIANQFLAELRDEHIQKDRMRFRTNMERLGEILAYEISKVLFYENRIVKTPLGKVTLPVLTEYPLLITILRAGIPFHRGFLNIFDQADSGFIGAFRSEGEGSISVTVDYASIPSLDDRVVMLVDPMLATGRSIVDACRLLQKKGTPKHIYIVSVVAAPEGIKYVKENLSSYSIWTCALDEKLNSLAYIVPGLGDAGDLSFGLKR